MRTADGEACSDWGRHLSCDLPPAQYIAEGEGRERPPGCWIRVRAIGEDGDCAERLLDAQPRAHDRREARDSERAARIGRSCTSPLSARGIEQQVRFSHGRNAKLPKPAHQPR